MERKRKEREVELKEEKIVDVNQQQYLLLNFLRKSLHRLQNRLQVIFPNWNCLFETSEEYSFTRFRLNSVFSVNSPNLEDMSVWFI